MNNCPIILASASPRRKELLAGLGYTFEVIPSKVDEIYPDSLAINEVPSYLAELKASALAGEHPQSIIVAADTVVILNNNLLGKPDDEAHAVEMLKELSGKKHEVITGVCVRGKGKTYVFSDVTEVYFKQLDLEEIHYYVRNFKPLDKAGAYGVQEWIGYVAVERIVGSFYNVMGLPVSLLNPILRELTIK